MDGVGRTLREARSRRRVDLAEIEDATKIRVRFLRAIENEEWDVLPGDAYARSFIRTYAGFLGLDGDRMVDEYRRQRALDSYAERQVAQPIAAAPRRSRRQAPRLPPRVWAVLVIAALFAVLVVVGISGNGGELGGGPAASKREKQRRSKAARHDQLRQGVSVQIVATGEVWVCLLDGEGEAVVNGQVLSSGTEAGPFRSRGFTVAFGNGEVSLLVDGREAEIPATASPIGYEIEPGGELRELEESERPTCT